MSTISTARSSGPGTAWSSPSTMATAPGCSRSATLSCRTHDESPDSPDRHTSAIIRRASRSVRASASSTPAVDSASRARSTHSVGVPHRSANAPSRDLRPHPSGPRSTRIGISHGHGAKPASRSRRRSQSRCSSSDRISGVLGPSQTPSRAAAASAGSNPTLPVARETTRGAASTARCANVRAGPL